MRNEKRNVSDPFGTGIAAADLRLSLGSLALQVGSDANDTIHFDTFDATNYRGQSHLTF